MKKTSILVALLAFFGAMISCTPADNGGQKGALRVSLSASESFTDNKANLTIVLSQQTASAVSVTLAVDQTAPGAIKSSALSFEKNVTVQANSNSNVVPVELVTEPNGPAKAYIKIVAASGAVANTDAVVIAYTPKGYSGGGEGGEEGGEGGGSGTEGSQQANWTVQVTGTELEEEEYNGQTYYYIAGNLTAPGSTYLYHDCFFGDEDFHQYGGESVAKWAASIESELSTALQSYSIDQVLEKAGEVYINYYESGDQYLYVLDFDAKGKYTGKYAIIAFTMPEVEGAGGGEGGGGEFEGDLTFCKDWKAEYAGDGEIDVTGVTDEYFMFDVFDDPVPDAELAAELQDMVDYNLSEYGYYYYGPSDYDIWQGLDNGQYYVYITGITKEGVITGNYGYSVITISDASAVAGKARLKTGHARRHHRGIKNRKF